MISLKTISVMAGGEVALVMGRPRMRSDVERESWSSLLMWFVSCWMVSSLLTSSCLRAEFSASRPSILASISSILGSLPQMKSSLAFIWAFWASSWAMVFSMSGLVGRAGGEGVGSGLRRAGLFLWCLTIGKCKHSSRQQLDVLLLAGWCRRGEGGQAGGGVSAQAQMQ